MRLNRFLAAAGLGSRRSCEDLIRGGTVTINGKVCENLATEVKEEDFVKVGSRRVQPEKSLYVLLHKPRGYLCTASDTHDRRTIFHLLPGTWPRLFSVGRLDLDSEGLLILTNDGDLALQLTHPRFKIDKEYEVLLDRPYDAATSTPKLLHGVSTEHGRARADSVRQMANNVVRITLRQGLKRQIRVMLYKVGYEVKRLVRMRIGPLRLVDLPAGEWRQLTVDEVKALRENRSAERVPEKKFVPKKVKPAAADGPAGSKGRPPAAEERPRGKGKAPLSRGKPGMRSFAEAKPRLAGGKAPRGEGKPYLAGGKPPRKGKAPFGETKRSFDEGKRPRGEGETRFGKGKRPFAGGGKPYRAGDKPFRAEGRGPVREGEPPRAEERIIWVERKPARASTPPWARAKSAVSESKQPPQSGGKPPRSKEGRSRGGKPPVAGGRFTKRRDSGASSPRGGRRP